MVFPVSSACCCVSCGTAWPSTWHWLRISCATWVLDIHWTLHALIVLIVTNILWYCFNAPGIHTADPIHLTKSHKSAISCLQKSEKSIPLGKLACSHHFWPPPWAGGCTKRFVSLFDRVSGPWSTATRWLPVSDYQGSKAELRTGMCSRQPLKSLWHWAHVSFIKVKHRQQEKG